MGEFRTPGYDGPEGTEWPRPKRKDELMAQQNPELPADLEGTVITVAVCSEHGAHIKVLAYVGGKPISVQQMTPEQAREVANDLTEAAGYADTEIARHRAHLN